MTHKVGDTLWFVLKNIPHGQSLRIEKVGRKWLHTDGNYRVDIETLTVMSGDYDCGRCYPSRDEYETGQNLKKAWSDFVSDIRWGRTPPGVTFDNIAAIRALLWPDSVA